MQQTNYLRLNKPELNNYVNVNDLNENMDILDGYIEGMEESTGLELGEKVNRSGDTMEGVLKAQPNTSYTTAQTRNIILSTSNADVNLMQNGEIWIKYK